MKTSVWTRWILAVGVAAGLGGFFGGASVVWAEDTGEETATVASEENADGAESADADAAMAGEESGGEGGLMKVQGEEAVTEEDYAKAMEALDQALAEASAQLSQANSSGEAVAGGNADPMPRSLRRALAPNTGFLEGASPSFLRTVSALKGGGSFSASDSASHEAYADGWSLGDNGGSGFKPWKQTGVSAPTREISAQDGFVVGYDGGLGRELETPLVSGSFTVDAKHGFDDRFSGFALYGENDEEILRWGVTTETDRETGRDSVHGLWYAIATDGQNNYVLWSENRNLKDLALTYSITWSQGAGGGLSFGLTALDAGNNIIGSLLNLSVENVNAIYGVGVLVAGNSTSDKMSFNNLTVDGDPLRPVPEPSTLLILLLGAPLCALRGAGRGRKKG